MKKEKALYDLKLIEVGDKVFEDCDSGPCSGGSRYGLWDIVTKVTETKIYTQTPPERCIKGFKPEKSVFSRKTGRNVQYPVYSIQWFYKSKKK